MRDQNPVGEQVAELRLWPSFDDELDQEVEVRTRIHVLLRWPLRGG